MEGGRDVVAPEVRVPVLRKPCGEEGRLVPQSPAALFPVGLPRGSFLMPRGVGQAFPVSSSLSSGLDQVGGDPMQELRWERAASDDPSASCLSFCGAWGLVHPHNRAGRRAGAWETVSYLPAQPSREPVSLEPPCGWWGSRCRAGEGSYCSAAWARVPRPATRPLGAGGQQAASRPGGRRAVAKVKAEDTPACPGQSREEALRHPQPGPTRGAPLEATSFWGRS